MSSDETPTVLVADRGRSLVPSGQTVLGRMKVEVVNARRRDHIIGLIDEAHPTLLILGPDLEDITIPDLCSEIRSDPSRQRISILAIVSPIERDRAQAILDRGANDVIYRPLNASEFDDKVSKLLTVPVRRHLRVIAQIQLEQNRHGFFSIGRTQNVSTSGLLFETDREFAIGDRPILRFFLPGNSAEIELTVEIVRETPPSLTGRRYGARYVDLSAELQERIETFIARHRDSRKD